MSARPLRFCIVTTANVCDNPRVVKEADALTAAGHRVRVVAHRTSDAQAARDRALMAGRSWELDTVAVTRPGLSAPAWILAGARQKAARLMFDRGVRSRVVRDLANGRHAPRIAARAAEQPADVVVAHHVPALPAAAAAALRLGASLVYDFEDLYVGNVVGDPNPASEVGRIDAVERAYVPACRAVIASSDGIADAVAQRYGVTRPTVVLNTFPREALREPTLVRDRAEGAPLSCYWFSQVIGPNRGLESAVAAIASAGVPVEVHLRGALIDGFDRELRSRMEAAGSAATLHLHPVAPPNELVAIAAQHDVGLALEQAVCENRLHAVTNKILTYFLAGNAIAATDTPAQRAIMQLSPDAGDILSGDASAALAALVRRYAEDPRALERAKTAARTAADARYSWEHDAPRLVAALEAAA